MTCENCIHPTSKGCPTPGLRAMYAGESWDCAFYKDVCYYVVSNKNKKFEEILDYRYVKGVK